MNRKTDVGVAPVRLLCKLFEISRQAYHASKHATKKQRVFSFPAQPRHVRAEIALAAIREVIDAEPAWGVRKVWATLRRAPEQGGKGLKVSRKRVHALMKANGLVLARDTEPGEPTRIGNVAVPEPNRRIATDLRTTWTRRDGIVAIVPTIDCGCRTLLSLVVTKDQHGPQILASLEAGFIAAFGSPKNVPEGVDTRTDHGPQYTSRDCEKLCDTLSNRFCRRPDVQA